MGVYYPCQSWLTHMPRYGPLAQSLTNILLVSIGCWTYRQPARYRNWSFNTTTGLAVPRCALFGGDYHVHCEHHLCGGSLRRLLLQLWFCLQEAARPPRGVASKSQCCVRTPCAFGTVGGARSPYGLGTGATVSETRGRIQGLATEWDRMWLATTTTSLSSTWCIACW